MKNEMKQLSIYKMQLNIVLYGYLDNKISNIHIEYS